MRMIVVILVASSLAALAGATVNKWETVASNYLNYSNYQDSGVVTIEKYIDPTHTTRISKSEEIRFQTFFSRKTQMFGIFWQTESVLNRKDHWAITKTKKSVTYHMGSKKVNKSDLNKALKYVAFRFAAAKNVPRLLFGLHHKKCIFKGKETLNQIKTYKYRKVYDDEFWIDYWLNGNMQLVKSVHWLKSSTGKYYTKETVIYNTIDTSKVVHYKDMPWHTLKEK